MKWCPSANASPARREEKMTKTTLHRTQVLAFGLASCLGSERSSGRRWNALAVAFVSPPWLCRLAGSIGNQVCMVFCDEVDADGEESVVLHLFYHCDGPRRSIHLVL